MIKNLQQQWLHLTGNYSQNIDLQERSWQEILKHYSEPSRHYHTLQHVAALLQLAADFREQLTEPDILLFSIWYHDIIYNPIRKDNEEKSATLAAARLEEFGLPVSAIENCSKQISATKTHELQEPDSDTSYLLDFDLSVLAADWPDYVLYAEQIRREYWMYPDFLYKKGRRNVLHHFLSMETIYKTLPFKTHQETKARVNIERELQELL